MKYALRLLSLLCISSAQYAMETSIDTPISPYAALMIKIDNKSSHTISIHVQNSKNHFFKKEIRANSKTMPFRMSGCGKVLIETKRGLYELTYNNTPPMQYSLGLNVWQERIVEGVLMFHKVRFKNMLQSDAKEGVQICVDGDDYMALEPLNVQKSCISNSFACDAIVKRLQIAQVAALYNN